MLSAAQLPLPCGEFIALAESIERIASVDEARQRVSEIVAMASSLLGAGVEGTAVARTISVLNDRVVCRVIALTAARSRLPDVPWCWLALGSEGRFEQTLVTDQDNGLVFSAAHSAEADALRRLFQPFAQRVNDALHECGFTRCPGEIMAGNAKWCLAVEEWEDQFIDWVRRPEPKALLHATIFFDLRPMCGDLGLGDRLRDVFLRLTRDTPAFLHLMAANALQATPPLGLLGDVVADAGAEGAGVDLKKFGTRIFVDAGRIFALAEGVRQVETRMRLREAGSGASLQPGEIESAVAAMSHLLRLRLATQAQAIAAGDPVDHCVDPATLNAVDRAILRESLRQAKKLQQRLKLNYGL